MAGLFEEIMDMVLDLEAAGHRCVSMTIGTSEAMTLEAELYRPARPERAEIINGRRVVWEPASEEYAPHLPLGGYAEILGVPVHRVVDAQAMTITVERRSPSVRHRRHHDLAGDGGDVSVVMGAGSIVEAAAS